MPVSQSFEEGRHERGPFHRIGCPGRLINQHQDPSALFHGSYRTVDALHLRRERRQPCLLALFVAYAEPDLVERSHNGRSDRKGETELIQILNHAQGFQGYGLATHIGTDYRSGNPRPECEIHRLEFAALRLQDGTYTGMEHSGDCCLLSG